MKKPEEVFNKFFPGKMVNAFQKEIILEYGDFLLEWSAKKCEAEMESSRRASDCTGMAVASQCAREIRAGKSVNG